ncbi:MAG: hypothetical protein CMP65_00710 [Flavobacteriales bacterium]|nr:hypothetical protein [Flavobacteriales bacterium]|tara:strand:- start:25656 stop:26633 length:978 start_codon:yes stop_codon:yes gene_type:complete
MKKIIILFYFILFLISCNHRLDKPIKSYVDSLSFLLESDSTNFMLLNQRASYYLENNSIYLAKKDIDNAFFLFKNDIGILLNRGDIYFELNQTRVSKESWQRCLKIDPNNIECRQKLTELLCIVRDQDCASMIDTLALLNQGRLDLSLIVYLKELKFYNDAIKYLNILSQDTLSQDILSLYSIIHSDTSKLNIQFDSLLAKKYFDQLMDLYPNNTQTLYNYAKFFQDIHNYKNAINYYTKAAKLDSTNKYLYYNMGFCAMQVKDYIISIDYFSKAILLDSSFLIAYHARAYLFEIINDKERAISDWKNCLLLDPSYLPAIEALSK